MLRKSKASKKTLLIHKLHGVSLVAIAKVEGRTFFDKEDNNIDEYPPLSFENDQVVTDSVLGFLESTNQLLDRMTALQQEAPSLLDITHP